MKFRNDKLHNLREDLGFSLQSVASAINSSKSYVWEIEQGNSEPSGEKVFKLARTFGVSMDYFYTDDETLISEAARIGAIVINAMNERKAK